MGRVVILASFNFHFIRVNDEMVKNASNYKFIIVDRLSCKFSLCVGRPVWSVMLMSQYFAHFLRGKKEKVNFKNVDRLNYP